MQTEAQASPAEAVEAPPPAKVIPIQAQVLPAVWNDVAPFLQLALDRSCGERTLGSVVRELAEGQAYLWMAVRGGEVLGTLVARIVPWDAYQSCEVWLMSGDESSAWLDPMDEAISAWAREAGCIDIRCYTRKGMERLVKRFGYQPIYTVLRKNLDGR